ncbi:984_t:CDS:1, partial [Funneliformis geosporum]
WNRDFNLESHEIHPADNETAKWILNSLFECSLELSSFLGSDKIFTDA